MKHITATKARGDFFNLIEDISTGEERVLVTSPRGEVVLISAQEWAEIEETLYLHSIPGLVESINEMTSAEALAAGVSAEDLGF